jgi:signal transduction histidine kinase
LAKDPSVAARLRDKIVFVGGTAQATGDRLFTPFSSGIGMPGVEIHANILHTLLTGNYLRRAGDLDTFLAMLAVVAGSLWVIARFQGLTQFLCLLAIGGVTLVTPYALFLSGQVWPAFSLLAAFGTTLLAGEAYQLLIVRRRYQESEAKRRMSQQRFEMAAHEMRTPLASIQASSELLARYSLENPRREQMMQLLYEESQRLGRLVERFLSVERLSAGEMELHRAEVHLPSCLSAIRERLLPLADRKGVQLVLDETGEAVEIEADPELLEFAVSNLVTNAVKYSPAGTTVRIAWERDEQNAQIHVSDTGPGMTPEQTRRIFDRFYRTDSAKDSQNPGFGLGLAIAREIARHHGGDIRVESKPGAGSRFTVLLPLKNAAEKRKAVSR